MEDIKGKVVLITGASGSIGGATAVEFARLGARLSLTGRDPGKLATTKENCIQHGAGVDSVYTITGDVTYQTDVNTIVDATVEKYGSLDVLVNCAGSVKAGVFLTTNMADYDVMYKTNLKGAFMMCKRAVPYLVKAKGCIVNISSFAGMRPSYAYFAYGMAEAALDQLTKALALELGPKGVRVNSVNPGVVKDTYFWTRDGAPHADKRTDIEEIQEGLHKMYPLGRLCETSDVAHAVTFLCSQNASFIHGAILPLDGGKTLTSKSAVGDVPQA